MSDDEANNAEQLFRLAAVLRPAFRCPTTPASVHELYVDVLTAIDEQRPLDAAETALRAVIMLRNAIDCSAATDGSTWRPGAVIDIADSDPDIGLHFALYGVVSMLDQLGWRQAA